MVTSVPWQLRSSQGAEERLDHRAIPGAVRMGGVALPPPRPAERAPSDSS